jgi:hypothetical protein
MVIPVTARVQFWCWVAALAFAPGAGHCLDLTIQAGYGARYTNNTQEAPEHGTGEWIQEPVANLLAFQQGPTTTLTADYHATREIHQRDIFDDETIVEGVSTFTWQAIASRLAFDASNTRTQTTINASGQNVPTNLQVTDTTTAGATLTLNSFSNHLVDIGYHYTFDNADTTNTDSRRQTGTVAYIIPLSGRNRIQLNGALGKVDYDSSTATNYDSREGDMQYVSLGDHVDIDTALGYTVFDQEGHVDNVHGTTGHFDVVWRATSTSRVTATYSRALDDGALNGNAGIPQFGQTFNDNSGLTQPYTVQQARLGFDTPFGHNTLGLTSYFTDQNYQDVTGQDQKTVGGTIRMDRRLRPTVSADVFVDYSDTEYEGQDRTDHNFDTGLRLTWTRWRNLTFYASTIYTKRTSDDPAEEYTEWVGAFSLLYTLTGPNPTAVRNSIGGVINRGSYPGGTTGGRQPR